MITAIGDDMDLEPPNDFRNLPILPTEAEICEDAPPFLRKNIIKGKYENAYQYLDIQFRLLREDFIRPLREGLTYFRSNHQNEKCNRDLKIYKRIKVSNQGLVKGDFIHYVEIKMSPNFRAESSKRLLFGNLLCFSNDNFKTLVFGYVHDRNILKLRRGIIGVKLESSSDSNDFKGTYDMAESRAYFVAYKYVLEALQSIGLTSFPLSHYLLNVSNDLHKPTYLSSDKKFDLRVVKDFKLMKWHPPKNCLFVQTDSHEPQKDLFLELSNIIIDQPINLWPSDELLSLDKAQKEALYGALTRQLAIIQGPPGTGKTFLGLKITQILLHNSDKWNNGIQNPILVVCYTNHALDQFLEGMVSFTRSIVRVGSRSKSDIISQFQISNLTAFARKRKLIPHSIHVKYSYLNNEVKNLETELATLLAEIYELKNPNGIFSYRALRNVIPAEFGLILERIGIENWLLGMGPDGFYRYLFQDWTSVDKFKASYAGDNDSHFVASMENLNVNDTDQAWEDANEFAIQEEKNRVIDLESNICSDHCYVNVSHMYDTTFKLTEQKAAFFSECLQDDRYKEDMELSYLRDILNKKLQMINFWMKQFKKSIYYYQSQQLNNCEIPSGINIFQLNIAERWQYYFFWISRQIKELYSLQPKITEAFHEQSKALMEMKNQEYLFVIRNADVVGMTTTGAAKFNKIIQALNPKIVIIEEAAEILEAHIVTSLTAKCEHLILIGDHQQLRPSTTVYDLAIKYKLETSLFERMINNGVRYNTLQYQHRMRPEISKLLASNIYPSLQDDLTVSGREPIKGIMKNIYFLNHNRFEDQMHNDNGSHENNFEATWIMAICRHLLNQGYSSENITILTPYSGQFFLLKKIQRESHFFGNVSICTVDNFQGEENDIILLSLVRGNPAGNVGFLNVENRVCVALSRAKNGFYMVGNMEQLCMKSELWRKIRQTLTDLDCIGTGVPLKCHNHSEKSAYVYSPEELQQQSPEGGCAQLCSFKFEPCGHACPRRCHIIKANHEFQKCMQICRRKLCNDNEHACLKKCWEDCGSCIRPVMHKLGCGHSSSIACYIDPTTVKCLVTVEKSLPECQHFNNMPCSYNINEWICTQLCDIQLDCGHKCIQKCHQKNDPEHEKYCCIEECLLLNKDCCFNHKCNKRCYENCGRCTYSVVKEASCGHSQTVFCHEKPEDLVCNQICNKIMPCKHYCSRKCHETCGGCMEMVEKLIPGCEHVEMMPCGVEPSKLFCSGNCPVKLNCDHFCKAKCKEPCTDICLELIPFSKKCPQNHQINVPCHIYNTVTEEESWLFCGEMCNEVLSCGHICKGKCSNCFNGRVHLPCKEPCGKTLVCGHICKSFCSLDCPPCINNCEFKCEHGSCRNKCSIPCKPCQKPCLWNCPHLVCNEKCGQVCLRNPCVEPCEVKLKCGHGCIGFCGDPCIHLCRICDHERLAVVIFPSIEFDEENTKYVLMEDCKHVIEVTALEKCLNKEINLIGMKKCPLCKKCIYNSRRYNQIIKKTYEDVEKIKFKYFNQNKNAKLQKEIKDIVSSHSEYTRLFYHKDCLALLKSIGMDVKCTFKRKLKHYSTSEYSLVLFKVQVLAKGASVLFNLRHNFNNSSEFKVVPKLLDLLIHNVLGIEERVSFQFAEEVSSELQRIEILPYVLKIKSQKVVRNSVALLIPKIETLLDPSKQFNKVLEQSLRSQLKAAEVIVRTQSAADNKRLVIHHSLTLRQDCWFKCPCNHLICLTECEDTSQIQRCPECKKFIGVSKNELENKIVYSNCTEKQKLGFKLSQQF